MTTDREALKITWEIPEYDGLPPVGSKVAAYFINQYGMRWTQCTIRSYMLPNDPSRPMQVNGNTPWVHVSVDGLTGIGFATALSDTTLLSIEKQPEGWPYHSNDESAEAAIRKQLDWMYASHRVSKDELAQIVIHWLKDNGYFKR